MLQRNEVDIIGGIDRLSCAEDIVGDWDAAAQD